MAARAFIVAFAAVIDVFEFFIVWTMTALGSTVAGAAAGCALGEKVAGSLGCAVGSTLGGFLGIAAQGTGVGEVLGFMLGYIMSICISLSFGVMLVTLVMFMGRFRLALTGYVFLTKIIPLIATAPSWTYYAWKSTSKLKEVDGIPKNYEASRASLLLQETYNRTPFADIRPARITAGAIALFLLLSGSSAYAQALPPPIQYVVTPEAPGPNETVTIEAQGVGSFLGSADLTWTQDGKVAKDGVGERTYTFTTGALGQKTTVRVSIDSSQGAFAQTFVFNPSLINLVWEADTTIPMLYKGKALYSAGSNYKVVALPSVYSNGARVSASSLSFQWSRADEALPSQSGLGRSILVMAGDQLQNAEDISVDVYYGNKLVGRGSITIPASAPRIVLYARDPLRGELFDAALPAAISLVAKEITVQAESYYFSNTAKAAGALPYAWTLGGEDTAGPDSARGILTLRQTGQGTGAAQLAVSIQNTTADQFVQTASANLQLVFGGQTGNAILNFFGL